LKLSDYPLLADENIHPEVIAALRQWGMDVLSVRDSGLIGSDDLSLVQLAYSQNRVILTHDSDFGTLVFTQEEPFVGVIYLRPGHILPGFTTGTLRTLLDQNTELHEPFIVVAQRTGDRVRVRVRNNVGGSTPGDEDPEAP
jgi:predicted nuclease of predicted toxin-antitoxin system